jgi:hypothetical protein
MTDVAAERENLGISYWSHWFTSEVWPLTNERGGR